MFEVIPLELLVGVAGGLLSGIMASFVFLRLDREEEERIKQPELRLPGRFYRSNADAIAEAMQGRLREVP